MDRQVDAPELSELPRWELYRLLADPVRLRLLALTAREELAVSELAELLGENQTKVSRHGAALRDAGILSGRRHGTWVLLKLGERVESDPVVRDAIATGERLAAEDGSLGRIELLIRARDAKSREYFSRAALRPEAPGDRPGELGAYLTAFSLLLDSRTLAIDVGTGDGALLDVLCPLFDHVIAIDRSEARLGLAESRARERGYTNVVFTHREIDAPEVRQRVEELGHRGADVVFASRLLHHAPRPEDTVRALSRLVRPAEARRPSGALAILDYCAHDDLRFKEAQADLWMGFLPGEVETFAKKAGLDDCFTRDVSPAFTGSGPDGHLNWFVMIARKRAHDAAKKRTTS